MKSVSRNKIPVYNIEVTVHPDTILVTVVMVTHTAYHLAASVV
jgi:hypothetical protein